MSSSQSSLSEDDLKQDCINTWSLFSLDEGKYLTAGKLHDFLSTLSLNNPCFTLKDCEKSIQCFKENADLIDGEIDIEAFIKSFEILQNHNNISTEQCINKFWSKVDSNSVSNIMKIFNGPTDLTESEVAEIKHVIDSKYQQNK